MKEKYTIQLHSVFFINKTKDLQCIHPRKICMKCYLLMNTASKRSSTILLKTYENWCPHDEHDCGTCVRITELSKEALGKIKKTSQNDRRGRPSLSKLFWSQEDLDMLSACSLTYSPTTYVLVCLECYIFRGRHFFRNSSLGFFWGNQSIK